MKELIKIIFPFQLHLSILQLEEYKIPRYLIWNFGNFFRRDIPKKRELIYTSKIKYLIFIYFVICLLSLLLSIFIFLLLILEPFVGLTLAVVILKPYETYNRYRVINKTRQKILSFKNLKVVGITGSFGKTSTKEILYQILKAKHRTLRTPESFNTVFGIAKVVDLELDDSYEYFICEMAAYKIGEIKELCYMVPPKYGILTGITTQHFERFGSLENTIRAKFELVSAVTNISNMTFNLEDKNIVAELNKRNLTISSKNISVKNINFNKYGSNFELIIDSKGYKVKTELFGFANIKNIILASDMAINLGSKSEEIVEAIRNLTPSDNRNVLIREGRSTIVNNTYSGNIQSFREMIATAKKVTGKKALVTPGIVELGSLEQNVHKELGEESRGVFDKVILVGKNNRTKSLATGLSENYDFIEDNRNEYFSKVGDLKKTYDWIFLENDVTQNY